mmetsp:Transcript_25739/g.60353  ORF Transcript_25739/g.60353 Transcript_25739/m.60353 type:complete len:358 (+) Transcript_25739:255-1328(+)
MNRHVSAHRYRFLPPGRWVCEVRSQRAKSFQNHGFPLGVQQPSLECQGLPDVLERQAPEHERHPRGLGLPRNRLVVTDPAGHEGRRHRDEDDPGELGVADGLHPIAQGLRHGLDGLVVSRGEPRHRSLDDLRGVEEAARAQDSNHGHLQPEDGLVEVEVYSLAQCGVVRPAVSRVQEQHTGHAVQDVRDRQPGFFSVRQVGSVFERQPFRHQDGDDSDHGEVVPVGEKGGGDRPSRGQDRRRSAGDGGGDLRGHHRGGSSLGNGGQSGENHERRCCCRRDAPLLRVESRVRDARGELLRIVVIVVCREERRRNVSDRWSSRCSSLHVRKGRLVVNQGCHPSVGRPKKQHRIKQRGSR